MVCGCGCVGVYMGGGLVFVGVQAAACGVETSDIELRQIREVRLRCCVQSQVSTVSTKILGDKLDWHINDRLQLKNS